MYIYANNVNICKRIYSCMSIYVYMYIYIYHTCMYMYISTCMYL